MIDNLAMTALAISRARLFAAKHRLQQSDFEDAAQESCVAILKAVPRFDPRRGSLDVFLRFCADRHLRFWFHQRRFIRGSYMLRHRGLPSVGPLLRGCEPATRPAEEEAPSPSLVTFVRLLPRLEPADRYLLAHLLAGENLAQIARRLGVSRQMVWKKQQRLYDTLRRLLPPQ